MTAAAAARTALFVIFAIVTDGVVGPMRETPLYISADQEITKLLAQPGVERPEDVRVLAVTPLDSLTRKGADRARRTAYLRYARLA